MAESKTLAGRAKFGGVAVGAEKVSIGVRFDVTATKVPKAWAFRNARVRARMVQGATVDFDQQTLGFVEQGDAREVTGHADTGSLSLARETGSLRLTFAKSQIRADGLFDVLDNLAMEQGAFSLELVGALGDADVPKLVPGEDDDGDDLFGDEDGGAS